MRAVTVLPKFQIVIPEKIRNALKLRPGQKMCVIEYDRRIELMPERNISEQIGFLKGIGPRFEREKDRLWILSILQTKKHGHSQDSGTLIAGIRSKIGNGKIVSYFEI